MTIKDELDKKLGKGPIPGFKVMEWLRGVREADYELSIRDPKAYQERIKDGEEIMNTWKTIRKSIKN